MSYPSPWLQNQRIPMRALSINHSERPMFQGRMHVVFEEYISSLNTWRVYCIWRSFIQNDSTRTGNISVLLQQHQWHVPEVVLRVHPRWRSGSHEAVLWCPLLVYARLIVQSIPAVRMIGRIKEGTIGRRRLLNATLKTKKQSLQSFCGSNWHSFAY